MSSGFSPPDMAAHGHVSEGSKTSAMSIQQTSHSETDDTDDNDDDHRRGGVSLIDHPDPSPSPSIHGQPATKSRKRSRRAAKRGNNAHVGVPSSIPEEAAPSLGHTQNDEKMPEGQAMDQDDGDDDEFPVVTPFMHKRARNKAKQDVAATPTGRHGQGSMPGRFGGGHRMPPVGAPFPVTTPSSRFGVPQYAASTGRDVFATPTAASSHQSQFPGGAAVPASGFQFGGQRPGQYQESPFGHHPGPNKVSSGVFDHGSDGPADVMYRVPAPGNPGAQTEPRRLYQQGRAFIPGSSASSPQYQTPTGHTNYHQSSASVNFNYHEQMRAMMRSGPAQDSGPFVASPDNFPHAPNHMAFGAADATAPNTVVRVSGDSNFKMSAPPSNNALFQTSGVPSESTMAARSDLLNQLTNTPTGRPSPEVALSDNFFPFEYCWEGVQDGMDRGVIRIKNVPYSTTRSEVIAMLGRSTKILNDVDEGIHIIMERLNSKTNDIFIELTNNREASRTVERFIDLAQRRRFPRLGSRIVEIVMSSQSELMREMFPTARGLVWHGTTPVIEDMAPKHSWKTFKGFINDEEFAMLRRYAESPHRAPFARDCPQRPYEFHVSTLKKLPWHVPEMISFRERWMLYYYTERLVETLRTTLDNPKHDQAVSQLNEQLLKRLHNACMACPGFSAAQKNNLAVWAGYEDSIVDALKIPMPMPSVDGLGIWNANTFDRNESVGGNHIPKSPFLWNHIHALRPKAGVPFDLLEWYIATIREATMINSMDGMTFNQQQLVAAKEQNSHGTDYFGRLWCEIGLANYAEDELAQMKLRDLGEHEMNVIKQVIARALDPSKSFPAHLQVAV